MTQTILADPQTQTENKLSYQEFLQKYTGVHAEWVDGEVIELMTASDKHQDIVRWLIAVLSLFVETNNLGWLRPAPFNMKMPHINRGREPDVLFVCQERLHIVQSSHLSDAADMVIEIVSPESVGRDRGEKFVEYEAAGVREYWLIDPDRQQAEFYYLADDERYRLLPTADGVFRSQVLPHFWIKVAWLWQEPLPKVLDVARKLELL
ncbi:MAG TPA: Uma2 family endonuclease [Chloroflexi bacterium]|nr:Uma2 family endonuclease [Chloroflexota bacterium]